MYKNESKHRKVFAKAWNFSTAIIDPESSSLHRKTPQTSLFCFCNTAFAFALHFFFFFDKFTLHKTPGDSQRLPLSLSLSLRHPSISAFYNLTSLTAPNWPLG